MKLPRPETLEFIAAFAICLAMMLFGLIQVTG